MKHYLIFMGAIFFSSGMYGQKIEIYGGINTSIVNVITRHENKAPVYANTRLKIFPVLGYNLRTQIKNKFSLHYGLEFLQFGCNNYLQNDQLVLDSFRLNRDLVVSQLNLNINPTFETKFFDINIGYSLGYIFDKNQNFLYLKNLQSFDFHSGFIAFSHQINTGVSFKYKSNFIRINGRVSLTPLSIVNRNQIDISDNPTFHSATVKYSNVNLVIGRKF